MNDAAAVHGAMAHFGRKLSQQVLVSTCYGTSWRMRSRATLKQGEATEHHQDYLSKAHAPLKEGITAWLLRHRGKPGVWSASESPRFGVTSLRATSRAAGIAVAHMLGWGQIAENGVGVDDPRWNSNPPQQYWIRVELVGQMR